MKAAKYLVSYVAGLFPRTVTADTLSAVLKKARVSKWDEDGAEFMIFKAEGDKIVRIARNGHRRVV